MTSTYIVAYPHPTIPPRERVRRFRLNLDADEEDLLRLLIDKFQDHRDDLRVATLWKAGRLTVAQFPP